jgi:hypothetical protein
VPLLAKFEDFILAVLPLRVSKNQKGAEAHYGNNLFFAHFSISQESI